MRSSLRVKSLLFVIIVISVFVAFSCFISYLFYSDAIVNSFSADSNSYKTQFFIIFLSAMLLVGVVIIMLSIYVIDNFVIKPIDALNEAVASIGYFDDKAYKDNPKKLKDVDIKSGDEIERLYHTLLKNQNDANDFILAMKENDWESEHDSMTALYNKRKFDKRKVDIYPFVDSIYMACIDVINMSLVNSRLSPEAGDSIISKVARELRRISGDSIHTYRIEGDTFLIVMCGYKEEEAYNFIKGWNERVGRLNRNTDSFDCRIVWGGSYAEGDFSVDDVYKRADAEMFCQKAVIKNELVGLGL